jgi:hypothetical protein
MGWLCFCSGKGPYLPDAGCLCPGGADDSDGLRTAIWRFTLLFSRFGLGWRRVGPAAGLAVGIGLYVVLAAFSFFWLQPHTAGPLEGLSQRLSYRQAQLRSRAASA